MKSALILLGGMASRAGFRPKYLFEYEGETFLHRQIRILREVCDEIIISCRDDEQCRIISKEPIDFTVVDVRKEMGPVEGIRTGAIAARGEYIFIVACDMPLICGPVIEYLFLEAKSAQAAIPIWEDGNLEPLHSVYQRDSLIEYFQAHTSRRLFEIANTVNSVFVPVQKIRELDADLQSFMNINDLQACIDLQKINNPKIK
jgi:molybdopterin-guanine dinucleotide biosynthesis protein A